MAEAADKRRFMSRALELAERGRGKVVPNPMVGAVIEKNGEIIAEGYHRKAGQAHAEIIALRKAGRMARRSNLYLNLEPCCHTGMTGPCIDEIIKAGIAKVLFASVDPDPRVNGRGAARLKRAGVQVSRGLLKAEAEKLNDIYYGFHRLGRPFVILKTAQTLDGQIATGAGQSKWITAEKSRALAHRMRSEVDVVVVGMGTVRADNPRLTVRLRAGSNPYRLIVAGSKPPPVNCHLVRSNRDFKTIVAASGELIARMTRSGKYKKVIFWEVELDKQGRPDPDDIVKCAGEFGFRSMMIEGGPSLASSFIRAGLVDKFVLMVAPSVIGRGTNVLGDIGVNKLIDRVKLTELETKTCGPDIVITGYSGRGK